MARPATVVDVVYERLGGRKVLGRDVASEADLARVVQDRLPLETLQAFHRAGFADHEIEMILPARTRRHRAARKERLTVEESDRAVRLLRIQSLAEEVFGDGGKAGRWLRKSLAVLDGETPLAIARTEAGARVVEGILGRIAWGGAA
jgi:putative toxin-antitoxin system antitoxin component (TIGR02293 family)